LTAKPLLYLDVDGVLNPVCPPVDADFAVHALHGSAVLLSPRHGEWLRELAGVYELVWATTWESHANASIGPLLGLPPLPVVPTGRYAERLDGDWLPILRHAAGRPFAWIDDLIPPHLLRGASARPDRLLVPVDPATGLRRPHVDRLLRRPPSAMAASVPN
jgi:hypothetical protein